MGRIRCRSYFVINHAVNIEYPSPIPTRAGSCEPDMIPSARDRCSVSRQNKGRATTPTYAKYWSCINRQAKLSWKRSEARRMRYYPLGILCILHIHPRKRRHLAKQVHIGADIDILGIRPTKMKRLANFPNNTRRAVCERPVVAVAGKIVRVGLGGRGAVVRPIPNKARNQTKRCRGFVDDGAGMGFATCDKNKHQYKGEDCYDISF